MDHLKEQKKTENREMFSFYDSHLIFIKMRPGVGGWVGNNG